jgi:tetratricopeptide (TPR) repeat protein
MEDVAKDLDDLRIEGAFAHLSPLRSMETDGDMELVELALQLTEGADIPSELINVMTTLLKRSKSRSPNSSSSDEIEAFISMLEGAPAGAEMPGTTSEGRRRRREAPPTPEAPPVAPPASAPLSEDVKGMVVMAQIEASSGDSDAAIDVCDQVLNSYPDNVDALLVMTYALTKTSPEDAVDFAEDAMGIEDSPRTRYAHAYALYKSGAPWGKMAQDLVGSKIWKEEEQAWHVLLGEAYLKGGKKDKAAEEFNSALVLGDERTALMKLREMGAISVDPRRLRDARDSFGGVAWVRT